MAPYESPHMFNDGNVPTVGPQLINFYWQKKALIDLKKDMYFTQLADTIGMP